jgi:large subunit ribosomal protein L16
LSYGQFGLKSTGRAWVKADQIEACRVAVTRHMKRKGKVWIRIFPDKSVSKKPLETRQGKGKGPPEFWVAVVKPGAMIFEIAGVTEQLAREALRLAAAKLPMATMFITR